MLNILHLERTLTTREEGRNAILTNNLDENCRDPEYLTGAAEALSDIRDIKTVKGRRPKMHRSKQLVTALSHIPGAYPDLADLDGPPFESLHCYRVALGL